VGRMVRCWATRAAPPAGRKPLSRGQREEELRDADLEAGRDVRKGYAGCEVTSADALALVHVSTLATHHLAAQTSSSTLPVIGTTDRHIAAYLRAFG